MKTTWIIARKEFRDRLQSGWIIACMVVWLAVISLTSLFGLLQIGHIGLQGFERTTLSLLNQVQYLVPLLGLLVGHDLLVKEREDRTLNLVLASGISRTSLVVGKYLGGALTVTVPLVLGFAIAGALVGMAAHDAVVWPFLRLGASGLVLGLAFTGIGLLVSSFSRSRVQALVGALLVWGVAVFAFDLAVLGVLVSTQAVRASQEIEVVCDATHVQSQADVHTAFDDSQGQIQHSEPAPRRFFWIWLNPVDVFRVINLPSALTVPLPVMGTVSSAILWVLLSVGAAGWRLNIVDL